MLPTTATSVPLGRAHYQRPGPFSVRRREGERPGGRSDLARDGLPGGEDVRTVVDEQAEPEADRAAGGGSQSLLKLQLVPQRDAVATQWGDFGFQPGPAVVDRAAVQNGQAKAPPLVEAQRVDVVIGGDEPQAGTASLRCQPLNRLDEGGADPSQLSGGVEGEDLALLAAAVQHVDEHAHQPAVLLVLSDERRVVQGVDERTEAGHPGVVTLGKEGLDGWTVGVLPRADRHPITLLLRHPPGQQLGRLWWGLAVTLG